MSIALKITLGSNDHTLKDVEISDVDQRVRGVITSKFNGEIRQWSYNFRK